VSAGEGNCLAELVVAPEHQNKGGTLHGGLTATLVDTLSTVALVTHKVGVPGVTVDLHVS
jgi:acyl-coenzyme A thioesterase 13